MDLKRDYPRVLVIFAAIVLFFAAEPSPLFAGTITISPSGYVAIPVGGTVQFTATVALPNTAVTWSVAGGASNGTITPTGLYTGPATVPPNSPEIIATSVEIPSLKAVQFVSFLAPGPTVGQVAPNPLKIGGNNITVTGSGFQQGATVFADGVQLVTTFVSANTLTTSSYFGSAGPAAFYVNNPGSTPSNTVTVSVAPPTFTLTVVNGTGSGTYAAGTVVAITANTPPGGQQFKSWTGATVSTASAATTTLTMPAGNTTVTASYFESSPPTYTLTVVGGTGSSSYTAGTLVTITANPAPSGEQFQSWSGATVANATASTTTLTMPAANTTVTASYGATSYTLTVVNGTGSGTYAAGAVVSIAANAPPSGQQFQSWTGASVSTAGAASTTLIMPAANTTVTASYIVPVTVTISPSGYVAIPAGGTVQFTAALTGEANTAVTWSVTGGAANGTITAAGLYTGPATIPPNSPQIIATSVASPTVTASQFVAFLAPGPALTQVAPNPLVVGGNNITVTGSGFQQGAVVVVNSGGSPAQLVTAFVNSTTLTTSSYFGSSGPAAFYVKNPGSTASNSVTVPVSGPVTYTLTVVNGTGGGTYTAGASVTITAGTPPSGQSFVSWSGASVANANAPTTTIAMPAGATTVTANFSNVTTYPLTVVNGTGSGAYAAGNVVNISATPAAGQTFQSWSGAAVASPTASSTTLTMPAAATTVTATVVGQPFTLTMVNGVSNANGSPGGTYLAGTVVTVIASAPPSGQYFQTWTGANVASAGAPTTTLIMPAANITLTASYYTPQPIPFPVTTHPRLWITPADVTRLQSWATPSNPAYQGLSVTLATAVKDYNSAFPPGPSQSLASPVPANPYPDFGDTQGYTGMLSEEDGLILALNSLIDPSPANRITYAQQAHNLLMYAMNQAALGHATGIPFRDPQFATYNRASFSGHEWPLIVDWIYNATDASGNPILTANDKQTIQTVFMLWASDCLTASTTGGDNPGTPGLVNNLALLPGNQPYRMASNNYYLAHARLLTMISLALDPSDDPPVNPYLAPSALGNTLRGYINDATGAWLYEEFAMMGDPQVVAQAYNVPNNPTGSGFGLASGGLPPEGMLYGESFGYVLGELLALQTAGFNNPDYSGPQIGLIGAPVWDRYVTGFMSSFTPAPMIPASEPYIGSVYQFAGYGDLLRLWATPDEMGPFALLALLDQETGVSTHVSPARWFAVNAMEGGAAALVQRIPNSWGNTTTMLYFLLLDPAAQPAPDPRPNFPLTFYDAPAGRIVAHTDWTAAGTIFDYRASWISINHQDGASGQFGLFRKGEWLTKEMSNYDDGGEGNGATVTYHNSLGIQNWCSACAGRPWQGTQGPAFANGSQWMGGQSAGDPTTLMSAGAGYVYAASDLTNLYNFPDIWSTAESVVDVTQATRSILWLNGDYVVTYDRASSNHSGFKVFNMSLVTSPQISGNVATETMPDGQQLFVQSLLPADASFTSFNGASNLNPIADLEPTQYILQIQDLTLPTDTRFLNVLQGADPGVPMVQAAYVQSTGGTPFDGASFGASVVYFPVNTSPAFGGATLPAPGGVHTMYITGLTPNAGYSISVQANGTANTVTVSPGGATMADAAGVLQLAF